MAKDLTAVEAMELKKGSGGEISFGLRTLVAEELEISGDIERRGKER